ncbi:MAG: hypothetical protein R3E87_07395 [Burkholderiaceae bacterium]
MRRNPQPVSLYGKNGIELDLSPDHAKRLLDYQNGRDRLASRTKFETAYPVEPRFADGKSIDAMIDADDAEDAEDRAEMARLQREETERQYRHRGKKVNPNADLSSLAPTLRESLGVGDDPAKPADPDMPARSSVE